MKPVLPVGIFEFIIALKW